MALHNNDQDLPAELLEKLENLKVELDDGDITQKGYDKKRATLLEKHAQQQKEQEDALLASLGPEPSAADVVDFLDYLPSPTHSPPRPKSGELFMEQHHQEQQQQQQQEASSVIPATRTSSIVNHNMYSYQQQQPQYQQQPAYAPTGYPSENTTAYYPAASPRPRPYPTRPQYAAPPPQPYYPPPRPMYPQQRPMPFPGGSYQSQPPQPRPVYANRPMYPNGARPNGYYRPPPPPPSYPMQGRSPTLDQRIPYGYNNGGISRSSTQNSSQGRYS